MLFYYKSLRYRMIKKNYSGIAENNLKVIKQIRINKFKNIKTLSKLIHKQTTKFY